MAGTTDSRFQRNIEWQGPQIRGSKETVPEENSNTSILLALLWKTNDFEIGSQDKALVFPSVVS